jgi:hypothetical protein
MTLPDTVGDPVEAVVCPLRSTINTAIREVSESGTEIALVGRIIDGWVTGIPARSENFSEPPRCRYWLVMNASIQRRAGDEAGARQRSRDRARPEPPAPRLDPAKDGASSWAGGVEVLAAHWQAALGGFHHTGAPPSR